MALAGEADTLRGQLELTDETPRLEQQLSERETPQPPELAAKVRPVEPVLSGPAPSEANPAHPRGSEAPRAEDIDEPARRGIDEFGRELASAGVNVASLFSQFGVNHAEGGPFVPPPRVDQPAGGIVADRLPTLRGLAKALPLSTPLEHFQVGSRFGPRRDPFNDAAYMSPVYATAAGDRDLCRVSGCCLRQGRRDRPRQRNCQPLRPHASLHRLGGPKGRGAYADRAYSGALAAPRVRTCTTRSL